MIDNIIIGKYLDKNNTDLYLSLDNGNSWELLLSGKYIVSVGDHGSLIVLAHPNILSSSVLYSWD